MRKNDAFYIIVLCFVLGIVSCKQQDQSHTVENEQSKEDTAERPSFNTDSAYSYIEKQVSFGPRVPNTPEHVQAGDWLTQKMSLYADTVIEQNIEVKAYNGSVLYARNVIASFNPDKQKRILFAAHWDTRPYADQDIEDKEVPILGANDGASGVGVLIELARLLKNEPIEVGVDIIFFDAEDYGQPEYSHLPPQEDTYCLGSQYWSTHPHTKGYQAEFGILLDMVGAKGALFTKEGISRYYASTYVNKVWNIAARMGYSNYFSQMETKEIIDDHFYVNRNMNIPMIDIIQYDPNTHSGFGSYWHTHQDNMEVIDKNTLKAVGQTIIEVVYLYDQGAF